MVRIGMGNDAEPAFYMAFFFAGLMGVQPGWARGLGLGGFARGASCIWLWWWKMPRLALQLFSRLTYTHPWTDRSASVLRESGAATQVSFAATAAGGKRARARECLGRFGMEWGRGFRVRWFWGGGLPTAYDGGWDGRLRKRTWMGTSSET
jgi:hypothetical protein